MPSTKLPPRATGNSGQLLARIAPVSAKKERLAPSSTRIVPYPKEWSKIWQLRNSPGGKFVVRMANKVRNNARKDAPQSATGSHKRKPGYLKTRIGLYVAEDTTSMYVDVVTRAKTPKAKKSGKSYYYGRIQNQRRHYLPRGLAETKE